MRLAILAALAGCGTNGVGTVVYTNPVGQIEMLDVATDAVTMLDPGTFGMVSVAPDGQFAVYQGEDFVPKLNDLAGHVTALAPTGGCCSLYAWAANDVLTYATSDAKGGAFQTAIVAAHAGTVRMVDASRVAVSSDGARLAYLDRTDPSGAEIGDFVVEDLDGGNRRVLAGQSSMIDIAFTPDDRRLTYTVLDDIARMEVLDLATGDRQRIGPGRMIEAIDGGSRYSPDGREFLALDENGALVGVAFADGSERVYAHAASGASFGAAAYVDDGRVIANVDITTFEGDVGATTQEVVFTDGTSIRTLTSSDGSNLCTVRQVSRRQGQLGLECRIPALTDLAGELLASRNAQSMLGISGDGNGMVTVDGNGNLEFAAANGVVRRLAKAGAQDGSLPVQPPFAAYAP